MPNILAVVLLKIRTLSFLAIFANIQRNILKYSIKFRFLKNHVLPHR